MVGDDVDPRVFDTFVKKRRTLVALSLVAACAQYLGVQIHQITVLGNAASFTKQGRIEVVFLFAWVVALVSYLQWFVAAKGWGQVKGAFSRRFIRALTVYLDSREMERTLIEDYRQRMVEKLQGKVNLQDFGEQEVRVLFGGKYFKQDGAFYVIRFLSYQFKRDRFDQPSSFGDTQEHCSPEKVPFASLMYVRAKAAVLTLLFEPQIPTFIVPLLWTFLAVVVVAYEMRMHP